MQLSTVNRPGCLGLPCKCCVQRLRPKLLHKGPRINIHRIIAHIGEQARPEVEDGAIVKPLSPAQDRDVIQVAVLVSKQHIHFKQQRKIDPKLPQPGKPYCLFRHPVNFFGQIGLPRGFNLPVRAYAFAKQVGKGQDAFPGQQEIGARTAIPGPTMHFQPLHAVGHIAEPQFLHIGLSQQPGGHRFGQALVTEQIQLIPSAVLQPLFLVSLGGGLRDSISCR